MDFEDQAEAQARGPTRGVRFVRDRVTPENLAPCWASTSAAGDLLIDLAWNIDCCEILQWCHDRGVLYVNTSVEVWDPYAGAAHKHPDRADALLAAHERPPHDRPVERAGPTAVIEHGANPGPHLAFHQAGPARHRRAACWTTSKVKGKEAEEIRAADRTTGSSTAWP